MVGPGTVIKKNYVGVYFFIIFFVIEKIKKMKFFNFLKKYYNYIRSNLLKNKKLYLAHLNPVPA